MPLNLRLHHAGVGGMKSLFDKKVEKHIQTQLENPFSEWEGAGQNKPNFSKDDDSYGRPLPGSDSERRAQAAQYHIMMDIKYLCNMIWDCAEWQAPDGRAAITFGKLFNLYNAINDKVVGTLLRARKYEFVYFEGEMLYQKRDDDKVIELNRSINTIRSRFGMPPLISGGGEVEKWVSCIEIQTDDEISSSATDPAADDEGISHSGSSNSDLSTSVDQQLSIDCNDISTDFGSSSDYKMITNCIDLGTTSEVIPSSLTLMGKYHEMEEQKCDVDGNNYPDFPTEVDLKLSETFLPENLPAPGCDAQCIDDITCCKTSTDTFRDENSQNAGIILTFANPNEKAFRADIVSLLGQFACNLTFLRSSKGSVDSEINNTANKIFRLLNTKVE